MHAMLDEHVSSCAGCCGCARPGCNRRSLPVRPGWRRSRRGCRIIELEGAMPVDDIQVKRIPAVRVAELTATAARLEPASINPIIQPLYRELGERLGQAGLTPAGPATSYYEDVPDGDGVIVHAALPVNADPGSAHGFEITDLPEITQAAAIMHRGPSANVTATIQGERVPADRPSLGDLRRSRPVERRFRRAGVLVAGGAVTKTFATGSAFP